MSKILLTTESCSDLPKEILEQYHILNIPFSLNFPDRTAYDGQIPVQEIYDYYKKTKKIPTTNAVNPYEYTEFFEKASLEYPDCEIIHIGYSSACSCSFQNAMLGVKECKKAKVHLIDSQNVSGGLGNLTLRAAEIIKNNPNDTAVQLVDKIEPFVKKTRTSFVPDTLDFLLAGGRVSNAAAISASILKLKPRIDIIEGKLIASKKYRGSMIKVVPHLVNDFMADKKIDKSNVYMFYSYGTDISVLEELKKCLMGHGFKEIKSFVLGCVMTVHGGKGAIGLSATEIY
jgi:DegV family protein with EDD domain